MANIISLENYTGSDDLARFRAALEDAKAVPGTTVIVPPGTYNITTPLAREAQAHVMAGDWGNCPEWKMFSPSYVYDRGLDFGGHDGTTLAADGATLLVDGFMEPVSIHDCKNVTVRGFSVDHVRKPYSKGILTFESRAEDGLLTFDAYYPEEITPTMAVPRICVYSSVGRRFDPRHYIKSREYVDAHHEKVTLYCNVPGMTDDAYREIYLWHTFHSRPVILIERAENTRVEDVHIFSAPGMGITAMHAKDTVIEGLHVVPSAGEHMSTNTDATHFASCRGTLRIDGCEFEGQGDDTTNVHTYYYTPDRMGFARLVRLRCDAPTGTHTQSVDHPEVGDTLELVEKASLLTVDTFKVLEVKVNYEWRYCDVLVDKPLPDSFDGYLMCDPDETPDTYVVNTTACNHFARCILIKSRRAVIENCTVTDVFEVAVKVAAEAGWYEGVNTDEITIRNNRFVGCGVTTGECGGISVTMDVADPKARPQGRVTITDNVIEAPYSEYAVCVKRTKNVVLARNRLVSKGECPVYIEEGTETVSDTAFVQ